MDRAKRVRSQRMVGYFCAGDVVWLNDTQFLVNRENIGNDVEPVERFKVLGSTGNVYTIHISRSPVCDCPDCSKGNIPCKHIIFVFLKVLKVPETSMAWYQKGLTLSELSDIFNAAPPTPNGSVLVSTKVRNAFLKATGAAVSVEEETVEIEKDVIAPGGKRLSAIGEDCPVCYEEMTADEEKTNKLVFDEAITGCGKPLHTECFKMWLATVRAKGDAPTCVWCRTPWPVAGAAVAGGSKGTSSGGVDYSALGYVNMADVAGMSRSRDTSSYYHGPMRGRRIWEPRYEDD
ncbi:hypothetical protein BCR39DRAFT_538752 [Naematelia encephala]|uniref:SWIM-type domain-containing protein n=1 Tax=Naematelia encephala TaxID=71784 RepID=A0A1Y2AXF3_9TREE|nr:hypothetical protein BCR39DRAFT_538752 [Naematelia encephala]